MKKVAILSLLALFGCSEKQPEVQGLCISEIIEEKGTYFCLQEMNNKFCMINILSDKDGTEGIMINCGTIEPRLSKAFCASKKIEKKAFPNGIIYHCNNSLGDKDIEYCDYMIHDKIIVDGVKKDIKMGEIRCASKKHIDMHHNPL